MFQFQRLFRLASLLIVTGLFISFGFVQATPANEAYGIAFKTMTAQELDSMNTWSGYRLGVYVVQVKKNSPAYGQLNPDDIVMTVGKTGVDSAELAARALNAASGKVALVCLIKVNGQYQSQTIQLNLSGNGNSNTIASTTTKNNASSQNTANYSVPDLVNSYFDLLDFMRTQALGRTSKTQNGERQRVSSLIQNSWSQMDNGTRIAIYQIADAWGTLQKTWPTMGAAKQNQLRTQWNTLLLSPAFIYPPISRPQTYSNGGGISFQYPGGWTGGETEANGIGYLFLGPGGSSVSWEQVSNAATSPVGGFFTLNPLTSDLRQYTSLQGARTYAQLFVNGNAPGMKEIYANESAQGAIVVLRGRFPGQKTEKFFWILIIPYGDQYITCRMSGPVDQAAELVPDYWNILFSLQLKIPQRTSSGSSSSGGMGEAGMAWEAAWSRVSTAVVSEGWSNTSN